MSYSDYENRVSERVSGHSPRTEIPSEYQLSKPEDIDFNNKPEITDQTVQGSNSTGILGAVGNFFRHPMVIKSLKCLTALLVIGGLVAASVFTFGAALPAIAALTAASSMAATAGAFALLGTAVGLAVSSVVSVVIAAATNMHRYTGQDFDEVIMFLAGSFVASALITGTAAASGAVTGIQGLAAAKAGLPVIGTALLFGGGIAGAQMIIQK